MSNGGFKVVFLTSFESCGNSQVLFLISSLFCMYQSTSRVFLLGAYLVGHSGIIFVI